MIELAIVVPTFNERENLQPLLDRLDSALAGVQWEVIFVDDDSPDQTAAAARSIARGRSNVRVIQRIGRRGLSSACVEGMMATAAPYIAVMDADLQHDESILPRMLALLKTESLDVVVASRNAGGGSKGTLASHRRRLSDLGESLSQFVCKCAITDPMSGFFLLDRRLFEEVVRDLSAIGFKILVDILASSRRPVRLMEVPYTFRARLHGESKLDSANLLEYLILLADKLVGRYVPVRFAMFALSGMCGVVVHIITLWLMFKVAEKSFAISQATATFAAMTVNFLVNNWVTYLDRRLKGLRVLSGLLWFYAACSVGAIANYAIATLAYERGLPWYLAAAVGVMISSVWNYAVTSVLTWRTQKRRTPARSSSTTA
jgi:dolichol-phosphate mannosyltransferase